MGTSVNTASDVRDELIESISGNNNGSSWLYDDHQITDYEIPDLETSRSFALVRSTGDVWIVTVRRGSVQMGITP